MGLTRQSQMDRARSALRGVVSYADEIVQDERLRTDLRAALRHSAEAGDRVRNDIEAGGIATRLATDDKLRKKLRALLDDLDRAGERMRRKRSHRVRNALLVVGGAGVVVAVAPSARRWLTERMAASSNGATPAEMTT